MPNAWLNPGMSHDGLGHVFPFLTFEEAGEGGHSVVSLIVTIYP